MTLEELQKQYDDYTAKIDELELNIKKLKETKDSLWDKRYDIEREMENLRDEQWRTEAAEGKHKIVWYSLIPHNIHYEWQQMEKKISDGCTGDWYDGCRGCEKHCSLRAREQFMRKYNIKEIRYGAPENTEGWGQF